MIADIHFQPKYVFAAIDAGCAAVRVNPGNIKAFDDKVAEIARAASDAGMPDPDRRQRRLAGQAAAGQVRQGHRRGAGRVGAVGVLAVRGARLPRHQDLGQAPRPGGDDRGLPAAGRGSATTRCTWASPRPGPAFQGTIKSAVAFGALLAEGIGDTIRVSLSAPPVEEVKVGIAILESLGLRERGLEIVSCPSCGRAQVDVYTLADRSPRALEGLDVPLRVAVMGCVVNGPGEAREADLGVASGNGKGQIFVRGEVIKTVPESQIVETLIEEAMKLAEAAGEAGAAGPGAPTVTVS